MEVDIDVHLGGADHVVHDVFETDGTRITALHVRGFEEALRGAGAEGRRGRAGAGRPGERRGQTGRGCGPRRSRPGRSPVASSCSRTTTPDLMVAA